MERGLKKVVVKEGLVNKVILKRCQEKLRNSEELGKTTKNKKNWAKPWKTKKNQEKMGKGPGKAALGQEAPGEASKLILAEFLNTATLDKN